MASPSYPTNTKTVSVTASPGNLGVFVNEVLGEDYLVVSGLHQRSPLKGSVKPGDRLKAINGIDLKGWSLDRLSVYCKEQKEYMKNIEILQTPVKTLRSYTSTVTGTCTPSRNKLASPRKAVSPTSNAKHKLRPRPPMIAFETLRPPLPDGYQRKIVEASPGTLGIKVRVHDGLLKVHWVSENCKLKIKVDDVIERIDSFYLKEWAMDKFVNYCKENASKQRYLHVLTKIKIPVHTGAAVATSAPTFVGAPNQTVTTTNPSCRKPASAKTIAEALTQLSGKPSTTYEQSSMSPEQKERTVLPFQTPHRDKNGLYARPAERERVGMEWDAVNGVWVPEGPHSA